MKTPQEIEVMKRSIDVQLDEYETAINEAVAWYQSWKARQDHGFRRAKAEDDQSAKPEAPASTSALARQNPNGPQDTREPHEKTQP